MNPTLQRAVTSFYNLVYEAQTFATPMSRIDTAEQEHSTRERADPHSAFPAVLSRSPKTRELQPGVKPPRTLQCLNCDRPDPLNSPTVIGMMKALQPPKG